MQLIKNLFYALNILLISLSAPTGYREGVAEQPKSFLPSKTVSLHEKTVSSLLYRGLFKYDIYGVLIPDLADTWAISEEGLVYTVKLKDNQYWSDGRKIIADDLLYTSYKIADLAGVATDKVDDLTVRFTLPNKYAPFLSLFTVGIMPRGSEETKSDLRPIVSGDWRVARVERNGKVIRQISLVTLNPKYKLKKMVFKYYTDQGELTTAAKLGEIDGFLDVKPHELENFTDYKFPTQGIYYALYFNLNNEKFKDVTLRQKMEKVLPIKELIFDKGIGVQGVISRSVFTDKNLSFDKFDAAFTEEFGGISVKIIVPDLNTHTELAEKIKAIWKDRLGLQVEIEKIPPDRMLEEVINPRKFEVLLYGQEVGRDPDRYVNWHSTQKDAPGLNLSGFEHIRADRALEEGRNELDNEKRVIHYNELQKTVSENTPAIFLYHPFVHFYVSKFIDGIGEKYTFVSADRFLDLENWKRLKTN